MREEDHLISLEVGGNPFDARNLWPEPYKTKINNKVIGAKETQRANFAPAPRR